MLSLVLAAGEKREHVVNLMGKYADPNAIHRAMDFGLNLIDTAPGYEDGYSEAIVGAALRGRREGMFVIDKIDALDQPVAPQVDASLGKLGLDMVNLFVFHAVSELQQWEKLAAAGGGMEQLGQIASTGKVRFRGISSHHPEILRQAINSGLSPCAKSNCYPGTGIVVPKGCYLMALVLG